MKKSVKGKILAVLVFAGVLGVSGTSFAKAGATFKTIILDGENYKLITQTQRFEPIHRPPVAQHKPPMPPKEFDGKRPPLSRDIRDQNRPPEPPDKKHPPVSKDKKPPMPPHSDDRKPPEFDGKRPEPPKGR